MRDVEKVLLLCPKHKKAHMRRIRLMHALGWYDEGGRVVEDFRTLFPDEKEFADKMKLECDKANALASELEMHVCVVAVFQLIVPRMLYA